MIIALNDKQEEIIMERNIDDKSIEKCLEYMTQYCGIEVEKESIINEERFVNCMKNFYSPKNNGGNN